MKSLTRLSLSMSTIILLVSNSVVLVEPQIASCVFKGDEIDKCLNQQEDNISLKPCCSVLNEAVQAGFYCLCSLIGSTNHVPHLNNLLSTTSLTSGCKISIPPLNLCQELAPTPVVLPVAPELPIFSPFTPLLEDVSVIPPPPPPPSLPSSQESYVPFSSLNCNYMASRSQYPCLENGDTSSFNWRWDRARYTSNSLGNKAKTLISHTWLIIAVVYVELLLF